MHIFLKIILISCLAIVFLVPTAIFATGEVSFTEDTIINISGLGMDVYVLAGSVCDGVTIYDNYVSFAMSANSSVKVRSNEKRILDNNSLNIKSVCVDYGYTGYTQIDLPGQASATNVTVTPSTAMCSNNSSWGPGSGGTTPPVPDSTTPTTTTGQVTATASSGGKTTLTTNDNATATVELPANAVSSSTDIKITVENKTDVAVDQPAPSGRFMVGNYVYNFTATSGGTSVTTFSETITLTFTYTASQIIGLNEDTLKIYYWNGSEWLSMGGILDTVNNKITVNTNHFTFFVMMGEKETTPVTLAKPSDYGLREGDLIRATNDFDIFIISQYGYKRLFLNPTIFNMYGHLNGGWAAVKTVSPATRDAFITSNLYRYVNADKVYSLEITGEDTGQLHWLNITGEQFLAQNGKPESIFVINKSEYDWYSQGTEKNSL